MDPLKATARVNIGDGRVLLEQPRCAPALACDRTLGVLDLGSGVRAAGIGELIYPAMATVLTTREGSVLMRPRRHAVAVVAALLACALGACSDDPATGPTDGRSTPKVAAPKPPRELAIKALEAYLAVRDDLWTNQHDYDTKQEFSRHIREVVSTVATGPEAKDLIQDMLPGYGASAVVSGEFEHRIYGVERMPGTDAFTIKDCEDHSGVVVTENGKTRALYIGPNGRPLPDRVLHKYTVAVVGTDWLVRDEDFLLGARC